MSFLVLMVAFSLVGGYLITYSTPRGPWVFSDSVGYLDAGRNFAEGRGFVLHRLEGRFAPLHLRPPFYSFVLGVMVWSGIDPVQGARWFNIALFMVLILAAGTFTYIFTRNAWLTALSSLILLTQPDLLEHYAGMMSEPLYVTLTLLETGCLVLYAQKKDWKSLSWLVTLTAVLWMTRFAGVANWILLAAVLFLVSIRGGIKQVKQAIFAGVVSAAPFLIWSAGVRMSGWSPGVYAFDFHDLWNRMAVLRVFFVEAVWKWLPFEALAIEPHYRSMLNLLGVFFLGLICLAVYISYRKREYPGSFPHRTSLQWGISLIGYAFLHAAIVGFSYLFVVDPKPALNERVLLPSQITLLLGVAVLIYETLLPLIKRNGAFLICAIFFLPVLLTGAPQTVETAAFNHTDGNGYTSARWQNLEIIEELQKLPGTVPIVSNDDTAVLFFAERMAYLIPELKDGEPIKNRLSFGNRSTDQAETIFREKNAALVLFPNVQDQFQSIYGSEAEDQLHALKSGLYPYFEDRLSGIYFYSIPNSINLKP